MMEERLLRALYALTIVGELAAVGAALLAAWEGILPAVIIAIVLVGILGFFRGMIRSMRKEIE